jgi:glycosyltransferase involved in cell wall biosynthesis
VLSDLPPLFSVITPTFNRARTIRRAIESVRAQTFEPFEYIIIDDGSTDGTHELIADLLATDPRIRYEYSKNQGTSLARDLGVSFARGRYLTFLDSDDEYLPTHLEARELILAGEPAIELLHGGVEIVGDSFVADKRDPTKRISIHDCSVGGTFVIRRDLHKRVGGFGNVAYGDDTDFFDRAVSHGALIRKTDIPTYRYYRTEPDSLCTIVSNEGVSGIERYRRSEQ